TLTLDDAGAIAEQCRAVDLVSPRLNGRGRLKYGDQNTATDVWGITSEFFAIRNFELEEGRYFLSDELDERARVCLLGPEVVKTLYGRQDPLGTRVYINGQPFRVIGVLKEKGGSDAWWDDRAWVPVTTAMTRLFSRRYVSRIEVRALDEASMDAAEQQIERALRRQHRLAAGPGACWGGASYGGWAVAVTASSILLSCGFAVGIGLFFGLYPAIRAAALSPLQALRHQ